MPEPAVQPGGPWAEEITLTVPFHDLDPLEIVWHGHYARYFELARCALLERIGYNYPDMTVSGYAWPVIDLQVRYLQPLRFNQRVVVRAEIVEWEHRLRIAYRIRDAVDDRRLTRGSTTQVAVSLDTRLMCLQSPPVLFEKLGVAPSWA